MNHLDLAYLSTATYLSPGEAQAVAASLGWHVDKYFNAGPAQAYLFRTGNATALVFRGTEINKASLFDLLSNLGQSVGYRLHLSLIFNEARAFAEEVSSSIPLYVSGHSMGGALATLYGVLCGHKIKELVTFGAPKSIGRDERRWLLSQHKCVRYVTRRDWAPYWPPSLILVHPVSPTYLHRPKMGIWKSHWPESYIKAMHER